MDIPRPPLELFYPTPVAPTPLDHRFQDLISSVWIWAEQMKQNQKSSKIFSPLLKQAFYAYSGIISKLEDVIVAFYHGYTSGTSIAQLAADLDDLEAFVRVICGDDGNKLQLHSVEGKVIMVFPRGTPFVAEQIMLDVLADCRIDEKIARLQDFLLQSTFQNSIQAYFEFVKEICSTPKTLQDAFNEDQRKLNLKCASWNIQYREMESIRLSLMEFPRNVTCNDPRVKTAEKHVSVAAALDWVAKERAEFRGNIHRYHAQTHFNDQLCRYLQLEVPASLDDLSI